MVNEVVYRLEVYLYTNVALFIAIFAMIQKMVHSFL